MSNRRRRGTHRSDLRPSSLRRRQSRRLGKTFVRSCRVYGDEKVEEIVSGDLGLNGYGAYVLKMTPALSALFDRMMLSPDASVLGM